ncbi:MAG: type II secretion system F family protein [Acidobacteriota bacterium]
MLDDKGNEIVQSFLGENELEVKNYFEMRGYFLLKIKKDWSYSLSRPSISLSRKIKPLDFIIFNQEFLALIKSGIPILKAIEISMEKMKNLKLKEILFQVKEDLKKGKSLSEAFSKWEIHFSKIYTASLLAGERTANLEETLRRFIGYLKAISLLKQKIKMALAYPVILFIFSLIILAALLSFIIPRFYSFYKDFEASLPFITNLLISIALFMKKSILYIFILIIIIGIFLSRMVKKEKWMLFFHKFFVKSPYISGFIIRNTISIYCRTLSLLLQGGIPLVSAAETASKTIRSLYLKKKLEKIPEYIKGGESLSNSLEKTDIFPPISIEMIRVGESTASLNSMLNDVAVFYEDRNESAYSSLVSLVEPVVIIFMGILIAGILLSVYVPLFNIIRIVR